MIVRTNLVRLLGVGGIMIFPFCFVEKHASDRLIRHEMIHFKQALNLLVIPFYILYLLEWIRCLFIYGKNAYYYMCFEQEAFRNEFHEHYEVKYKWIKYLPTSNKIKLWQNN